MVAQAGIGLIRQHIRSTDRVHGITRSAGTAPNIVPAHSTSTYLARCLRLDDLEDVRARLLRCFEAGALATGATLNVRGGERPYAEVRHHPGLAGLYAANALALGRAFASGEATDRPSGSTDMGNVSLRVPSIHPFIGSSRGRRSIISRSSPRTASRPRLTRPCWMGQWPWA